MKLNYTYTQDEGYEVTLEHDGRTATAKLTDDRIRTCGGARPALDALLTELVTAVNDEWNTDPAARAAEEEDEEPAEEEEQGEGEGAEGEPS